MRGSLLCTLYFKYTVLSTSLLCGQKYIVIINLLICETMVTVLLSPQMELLYVEALYTIKHKIGTTNENHLSPIQDLYGYVQQAFDIQQADHQRLLARADEEKVCRTSAVSRHRFKNNNRRDLNSGDSSVVTRWTVDQVVVGSNSTHGRN